jgi:hypothetical protein
VKEAIIVSTVDFSTAVWRTSTFSGTGSNDNCVEIAFVPAAVGVRDSKHRAGGRLVFDRRAWDSFAVTCRRETRRVDRTLPGQAGR